MKRHILNVFCGIVCTSVLWCLLSCSNGSGANGISGYYVQYNSDGNIWRLADFKSVPGKVATFHVDNMSGKLDSKQMDYVSYTVSGDTITFQDVTEFDPVSNKAGKAFYGCYDAHANTLYLPEAVLGYIDGSIQSGKKFVPINENLFEKVVKPTYYVSSVSLDGEQGQFEIKCDTTAKTVTVTFVPYSSGTTTTKKIISSAPYEATGVGISITGPQASTVKLEWYYSSSSTNVGNYIKLTYKGVEYRSY